MDDSSPRSVICLDTNAKNLERHRKATVPDAMPSSRAPLQGTDTWHTINVSPEGHLKQVNSPRPQRDSSAVPQPTVPQERVGLEKAIKEVRLLFVTTIDNYTLGCLQYRRVCKVQELKGACRVHTTGRTMQGRMRAPPALFTLTAQPHHTLDVWILRGEATPALKTERVPSTKFPPAASDWLAATSDEQPRTLIYLIVSHRSRNSSV